MFAYLRKNSELYDSETKKAKVVPWNFAKFFLRPDGTVVKYFPPEEYIDNVVKYIDTQMSSNETELWSKRLFKPHE